ncbi:MAG: protein kinase [Anaerolineae bacterium]|nr:protein kinase [Anaerolineae bacterium]
MSKARQIGKYEIHERLGRGNFATVYRAYDTAYQRDVALKVLHPQWTENAGAVGRFCLGAQTLTHLRHSNISQVYEAGEDAGEVYVAVEYLQGVTLQEWLADRKRVTLEQALPILSQVATALDYAHARDMMHLDVNPANVMLEESIPEPHVTLLDFGLAQVFRDSFAVSLETLRGSHEYIAPEQLSPDLADSVGPAADRYALGVIGYQMLTGRLPFPGNIVTPVSRNRQHLPDPSQFVKDLPDAACATLVKMLNQLPESRYPTAREFVLQLQKVVDEQQRVTALLEQAEATSNEDRRFEIYEEILSIDPHQPEAFAGRRAIWIRRGDTYRTGNSEAAKRAYREAGLSDRDIADRLITTDQIRPIAPGRWEPHSIVDGKYEILEMVSITGRSIIYRAQEIQPPKDAVVIKRLKPEKIHDKDAVGRFEREIAVLRRVQHESVLAIYDSKTIAPDYYFVTAYGDLGTLQEYLDVQPDHNLPSDMALDIALSVCRGLEAVHRDGYVHRDVKPGNVFLFSRPDGSIIAKLGDFSISHMPRDRDPYPSDLTTDSWGMATPAYASPEQLRHGETDPRSDLYSWGIMLFEMLTGDLPTAVHPDEYTMEYLRERGIHPEIAKLLYKSLRPKKNERFQTAEEACRATQKTIAVLGNSPVKPAARRIPAWAILIALLFVAGTAVLVFGKGVSGLFPTPAATSTPTLTVPPTLVVSPTPSPTEAPAATATPTSTKTATPTQKPTATATPSPTATYTPTLATCLPDAIFVSENYRDGTPMQPGTSFVKTWQLKSSGCSAWPAGTTLQFVGGDRISSITSVRVGELAPGEILGISVAMVAPQAPGTYTARWRLQDGQGTQFGAKVQVQIVVPGATEPPTAVPTTTAPTTEPPPQTTEPPPQTTEPPPAHTEPPPANTEPPPP